MMKLTPEFKSTVISLYETGHGVRLIAKLMGKPTAYSRVAYIIRKAGLGRSIAEAAAIPRHNTRIPSECSFLPLNPQTAWLLGLIFSDGSIRRDGFGVTISVGDGDADAISKISGILGGRLHCYKNKQSRVSAVQINSKRLSRELQDHFGLTPDKSSTMRWPVGISFDLLPHFVRGLYDGDGSWYLRRERGTLRSGYASCSADFMMDLRMCLINHIGISTKANVRFHDRSKKIFDGYPCSDNFTLELGHKDSTALGHWLYDNVSEAIRYERKYQVWLHLNRPLKTSI